MTSSELYSVAMTPRPRKNKRSSEKRSLYWTEVETEVEMVAEFPSQKKVYY